MKVQINLLKLFLTTFIILFFTACKKKKNPEYYKFPLGEAKSYLYALEGSYWIYKNTVTGDLDTQTCTGFLCDTFIEKGTEDYSEHITVEYERIWRTIESSFNQWQYFDETLGYNPNSTPLKKLRTILNRSSTVAVGSKDPFFYPCSIDERYGGGIYVTICRGFDSTLLIQGKTYNSVIRFEFYFDDFWYPSPENQSAIYYWAKDVGLVKRENITENYSWELKEYKIIR